MSRYMHINLRHSLLLVSIVQRYRLAVVVSCLHN